MNLEEKLVIEVAINENLMRETNPNIPYTPEEMAQVSLECYNAGDQ